MTEEEAKKVCDVVRQTAYDLHVYLGVGYLEKVYENGLVHRLQKKGLQVQSVVALLPVHIAQCLNYLKAMNMEHGLIINFGSEKFQCQKVVRRQ